MLSKIPLETREQRLLDGRSDSVDDNPYIVVGRESLVEGYKRNKISIHAHLLVGRERKIAETGLCAIVAGGREAIDLGARFVENGVVTSTTCDGNDYPPMLVHVGEVLQEVQGATCFSPLASNVRLRSLDFCRRFWGDPLEAVALSTFDGGFIEGLSRCADRELITIFGFVSRSKYKLPHKVVKGTPEIVDAVSNYERDIFGDRDEDFEPLSMDFRVWIALENQFAHIGVKIPASFGIERLQMLFCPLDFLPDGSQ